MSAAVRMDRDYSEADLAYGNGASQATSRTLAAEGSVRQAFATRVRRRRWVDEIIDRLDDVCDLEAGWDGYDGQPIRYSTCDFAKNLLLNQFYSDDLPIPDLVPTTVGGLQIEWHCHGRVIEVNIIRPYSVECYFDFTEVGGDEDEFECKSDYSRISGLLKELLE